MNTYYWIKLYYDLLDDYKVGNLPDSLKWRFIQCLLVAGEAGEDGFLPKTEEFAYRIRPITPEALNDDLSRMAKPGLVELRLHPDGDERWYVSKFSKRQEKISNAERQRSWRARKAAPQDDETGEETDLLQDDNGSITSRYVDKIRKETDRDSDTDTEKTRGAGSKPTHPVWTIPETLNTPDFEAAWIAWFKHRLENGRYLTQTTGETLLAQLSELGSERAAAAIVHSIGRGWLNVYEPDPAQNGNGQSGNGRIQTRDEIIAEAVASVGGW